MSFDIEPAFQRRLDDHRGRWAVVVVGLVLTAVVGTGLLPTDPEPDAQAAPTSPRAELRPASTATPVPTPQEVALTVAGGPRLAPLGELTPGRSFGWQLGGASILLAVPRFGWVNHGDAITSDADGSHGSPALIYWTWHREGALPPCPGMLRRTVSAEDLARAIEDAPGTEVIRVPSDMLLAGLRARRVVVRITSDDGCDPGYLYGQRLDATSTSTWSSTIGDVLRFWVIAFGERRLVIAAATHGPVSDALEEEFDRIVRSMSLVGGLVAPPPAQAVRCLPPVGPLEPGWYSSTVTGRGSADCENFLRFFLADGGWSSTNADDGAVDVRVRRGTPGSADGVLVRFGDVTQVFGDPCSGTLMRPAIDGTVDGLTGAIGSMRGVVRSSPTSVRLRWSTASYLEVTIPSDLGCPADRASLWLDGSGRPRRPAVVGATIRLWIFHPNDHPGFGRVVIEAETNPDADPIVHGEMDALVASIDHGG